MPLHDGAQTVFILEPIVDASLDLHGTVGSGHIGVIVPELEPSPSSFQKDSPMGKRIARNSHIDVVFCSWTRWMTENIAKRRTKGPVPQMRFATHETQQMKVNAKSAMQRKGAFRPVGKIYIVEVNLKRLSNARIYSQC